MVPISTVLYGLMDKFTFVLLCHDYINNNILLIHAILTTTFHLYLILS